MAVAFFFPIVTTHGRLAQFRAAFPAGGSWLQGKILFLSMFLQGLRKEVEKYGLGLKPRSGAKIAGVLFLIPTPV